MSKVAEALAEKLKDKKMDIEFVLDNLREMATKDYEDDPQRRERVVRLVGAMNELPMYEVQHINPAGQLANGKISAVDAETIDDLKMLEE